MVLTGRENTIWVAPVEDRYEGQTLGVHLYTPFPVRYVTHIQRAYSMHLTGGGAHKIVSLGTRLHFQIGDSDHVPRDVPSLHRN